MAKSEAELRTEAVRRRLAGEAPEEIARSLGRSRRWVSKWVGRHDPSSPGWAEGGKRGPKRAANRAPASLEAQVLAVRGRLAANPWAQIGAEAIAWELRKLGIEPPPPRTIEQIVARAGASGRPRRERRKAKGIPYPAAPAERAGDLHEADLVGPRHLQGGVRGVRFYARLREGVGVGDRLAELGEDLLAPLGRARLARGCGRRRSGRASSPRR